MKVLLAENSPDQQFTLKNPLTQWGYDVVLASGARDIIEKLDLDKEIQMVLLDLVPLEPSPPSAFQRTQIHDLTPPVYTLLLTEKTGQNPIAQVLNNHIDDYIFKPYQLEELRARIKIGQHLLSRNSQLIRLTADDPMTGLLNKRSFMNRLGQELSRSRRTLSPFAVAMITIDNLDLMDHDHGPWVKNQVLKELAFLLTSGLRVYDFAGRPESSTFLIGICDINYGDALEILNRVHQSIDALTVPILNTKARLIVNTGVSMVAAPFEDSIESVLAQCGQALNLARQQGKNQVTVFDLKTMSHSSDALPSSTQQEI
jgi:diguanylate cyclase (GGDEF)-like protein